MDSQQTVISEDPFHPLLVEWLELNHGGMGQFLCYPDGTSRTLNGTVISLFRPGHDYDDDRQIPRHVRILNIPALTALHLRDWLIDQSSFLEEMAECDRGDLAEKEKVYPHRS